MRSFFLLPLAALSVGCVNVADQFAPVLTDAPFVYDIGELRVIGEEELVAGVADPSTIEDALHYGQLGAGENPGVFGGATFQFRGTGSTVCVVVDPESIFWNKELSTTSNTVQYKYEDLYTDDGDIDLSVGLTAYYTGSPGTEIGDFQAEYTDASGIPHYLEFNECRQVGYFGDPSHAGRATVEYCNIDTSLREGVLYTAVLETFALPIDDSVLNFGTMAFDGTCQSLPWINEDGRAEEGATECVIPNEVGNSEPTGVLPEDKAWFPAMETAFCGGKGKVNSWCKDNPGAGCQEGESVE